MEWVKISIYGNNYRSNVGVHHDAYLPVEVFVFAFDITFLYIPPFLSVSVCISLYLYS